MLPLTDSDEGKIVLAGEQDAPPMAGTRSGQQYLKKYNEAVASSSNPTKEAIKQPMKQLVEKQKELRYSKALQKVNAKGSSTSFHFDVLAQTGQYPNQDHSLWAPKTLQVYKKKLIERH